MVRTSRHPDVDELAPLQTRLLVSAIRSTMPGGVVAYVACLPHEAETEDVVQAIVEETGSELLDAPAMRPEVPNCTRRDPWAGERFVQLWPRRHGTDAMFLVLLRVGSEASRRVD